MIYALDTNIISYILNGNTDVDLKLDSIINSGDKVVLPLMVYYEAKRGLLANNAINKMRVFEKLCKALNVNSLTTADMNTAANIYAKNKRQGTPINDADLLIAAQCIANNYTLVTNNVKHFKNIDGLIIENWIE